MPVQTIEFLQSLLLPLVLGALVVAAVLVWLVGRQPKPPQRKPVAAPQPQPAAVAAPVPVPAPVLLPVPVPAPVPVQLAPPTTTVAAAPAPAPCAAPAATKPGADLLLVDDSAVVRAKLRRLFEPAGYSVALARDGQEALALLATGRYGLMLTDLEMPRLDGLGLVRACQAMPALARMPILAITGHDDLQQQLNQLQAVHSIYRKPWRDDDLLADVQSLLLPSRAAALTAEA